MLRIKNGRVIDPASSTDEILDVWVEGERISRVAPAPSGSAGGDIAGPAQIETLDATGLCVTPGFIDLHCHLREPGFESSETMIVYETRQLAAAAERVPVCGRATCVGHGSERSPLVHSQPFVGQAAGTSGQ